MPYFDVLNIKLVALLEWVNGNKFTLNLDKSYMLSHKKRIKTHNLRLTICQGTLKQTS